MRADGEPNDMENLCAVSAASRIAKAGWTTCREAALAKKSEHEATVKETHVTKLEDLASRKQRLDAVRLLRLRVLRLRVLCRPPRRRNV